jgi:alpha-L-rhamnosidase
VDGQTVLVSGEGWKCLPATAVIYNQLRSGEYFDSRLYDPAWSTLGYNDSTWGQAVVDSTPPTGVLRECLCEPMRECAEYPAVKVIQTGEKRFVFDIGQNIAGYIRLKIKQAAGDVITIRYAEQLNADGSLNLNNMAVHYKESPFMTDRLVCNGAEVTWSPMFVYHGFRYLELEGITQPPTLDMVSGIVMHQDVRLISTFESSDEVLNKLFRIGQMATLSNLAYMPTDCPTREKLGWANDAQSSTEQMLTNFSMVKLFEKWMQDILDAMRADGAMPGIIPTGGWGYQWGNGPVSDGIMFEIPYKLYLFTGKTEWLVKALPNYKRYFAYLLSQADPADGMVGFGLDDWAPPTADFKSRTPAKFINAVFYIKFLRIARLAAGFAGSGEDAAAFEAEIARMTALIRQHYIAADGTCTIQEQCAVAMLIFHGLYVDLDPLKRQLLQLIAQADYHHTCGMVGLRHLYIALNICGLQEVAYRIITARGYPGYRVWLEQDATTLWETWQPGSSKNHHMYSDFMSWLMKTIVGINPTFDQPGFATVVISPAFIGALEWARGSEETVAGRIETDWRRIAGGVLLSLVIPDGITAEVHLPGGRVETRRGRGTYVFEVKG